MQDLETLLQKAYSAESDQDLLDLYNRWASTFDRDVIERLGYRGHMVCAEALLRHFDDTGARVLDVGCGTGLVAEMLFQEGYSAIDGLDLNRQMLEKAGEKGVYRKLIQADLNEPLEMEDGAYDAVVCAGTFTYGHVRGDAFSELARVTRPGGVVCFTIRDGAYQEYGYRKSMLDLETADVWTMEELRLENMFRSGVTCRVGVFRIN